MDSTFVLVLTVIGAVTGIASLIVHWISRRKPSRLVFQYSHIPIIDADKMRRYFRDDEGVLKSLSMMRLIIWNKASRPLRYDEVSQPIYVYFGDKARILNAYMERTARPDNPSGISVSKFDDQKLELKFHHLNKNDGASLWITHESHETCPTITGSIIGRDVPPDNLGTIKYGIDRTGLPMRVFLPAIGILVFFAIFGFQIWFWPPGGEVINAGPLLVGVTGSQAVSLTYRTWKNRRSVPRELSPPRK